MAFLTHWWRFFLGKVVFFGSRDVARIILLAQQPLSRRQRGNNNNNKQKNKNKQKTIATGSRTVAGGPMLVTENDLFSFFFHWRAVTSSGRDHAPGLIMQMPTWLILSSLYPGTEVANPFQLNPVKKKQLKRDETQKRVIGIVFLLLSCRLVSTIAFHRAAARVSASN